MTAEPDLLPLLPLAECSEDSVREWCRANVAHATAARDAEVEALRADVEAAKRMTETVHESLRIAVANELAAEARAERLAEALRWALPLASQGLEMCRLERLRCGHGDITGTYKNGETWAGIHQEEVDGLERAHAALDQEDGRG